jgi:hypothetical protein
MRRERSAPVPASSSGRYAKSTFAVSELVIFEGLHKGSGQHWEELERTRTRKRVPNSAVCSATYYQPAATGNLKDKRTELACNLERCPRNFDEGTNWEGKQGEEAHCNVDTAEGPEARIEQKRFCIVDDDSLWECMSYRHSYVYH